MLLRNRLIQAIWFAETLRRPFFILPPPVLASSSRHQRKFSKGASFSNIFPLIWPLKKSCQHFSPDYYTAPVSSCDQHKPHRWEKSNSGRPRTEQLPTFYSARPYPSLSRRTRTTFSSARTMRTICTFRILKLQKNVPHIFDQTLGPLQIKSYKSSDQGT